MSSCLLSCIRSQSGRFPGLLPGIAAAMPHSVFLHKYLNLCADLRQAIKESLPVGPSCVLALKSTLHARPEG